MDETVTTAPTIIPSMESTAPTVERKSRKLIPDTVKPAHGFARILKDMRAASGLNTRQIARKMGITRESLSQYMWLKRGAGGTSRLSWFLRYAEATGCKVWLTFPSGREQIELVAEADKADEKAE